MFENKNHSPDIIYQQHELEERERLAKENEEILRASEEAARAAEIAMQIERESAEQASTNDLVENTDVEASGPENTTVEVTNYNTKTRVHEIKAHFLQFGDLVEVAMLGKSAYVTFERAKDAADAIRDGGVQPLLG